LAIHSNGKLVVTGGTGDVGNREFILLRYKPNGTLDNTSSGNGWLVTDFGGDDCGRALFLQWNGMIVAAGRTNAGAGRDWNFALSRYLP